MNSPAQIPSRIPSLDGWRAVSIAMVLFSHGERTEGFPAYLSELAKLFNGALGVQLFFIISGFLITLLMLREEEGRGRVSLKNFYARRALRILPAYLTFLAGVLAIQIFTPVTIPESNWIANLTFTANYEFRGRWITGHLWSLSVEEQFYLAWPFLFVAIGLFTNRKRAAFLLGIAIIAPAAIRVLAYKSLFPQDVAWLFGSRSIAVHADSLAFGCASAFVLYFATDKTRNLLTKKAAWFIVAAAILLLAPHISKRFLILGAIMVPFGSSLQSLGFCVLLLQSTFLPHAGLYRALNWKPIEWLGACSYSIYLWHMPWCMKPAAYGLSHAWWLAFPFWMLPAILCGAASFYSVERYFLQFRRRFR